MALIRPVTLAALLAAIATPSHADDQDFAGTWAGDITFLVELDGKVVEAPRQYMLVIEVTENGLVRGVKHWTAQDDTPGNFAGVNVLEAGEPLIGVVDVDDPVMHLVEVEDAGTLTCELLGPDDIEVTYLEPYPHAVAGRAILHRVTP